MKRLEQWAKTALRDWFALPWATKQEEEAYIQGVARGIRLVKRDLEVKLSLVIADRDAELAGAVARYLRNYGEDEIEEGGQ